MESKSFANIQELFDKDFKRVNTFVDFRTKLVEGSEVRAEGSETREESSSKRAGDELEQENAKKQKVDDDQEVAKMKELMKIIIDEEEVAVDVIPLATKPPSIVDWKIEGKISYYQIIRADGSSKRYSAFIQMLRSFDKEDLETLWKLVKAKHGRIVGIKRLLDDLRVTATQVDTYWKDVTWVDYTIGLICDPKWFKMKISLTHVNAIKLLMSVQKPGVQGIQLDCTMFDGVLKTTLQGPRSSKKRKCTLQYFKPPPNVDHPVPKFLTPVLAALTSSPSLTTVDQDAPSTSTSKTTLKKQSSIIP
ncbi:hypothetical protein Tco_0134911 [Tanacetum coccineum]